MKKTLLFLLCGVSLLYGQVTTNGLVAYYPFCGNAQDASGNNYHLTPTGSPLLSNDRFGAANNAYVFNGSSDYFKAQAYGPMNGHSRTVTFWAKMSSNYNGSGYAVLSYGGPTGFGTRYEVGLNGQCNSLYNDVGYGQVAATYATTDNLWHFYAVSYDSLVSNDLTAVTYYIDGIVQSSFCYNYGNTMPINTGLGNPITIGYLSTNDTRYFNGSLDEVRLYNRTLSSAEIMAIKTSTCSCVQAAPVAVLGSTVLCSSAGNNYSVAPVAGASSYLWTLPPGWSGSSTSNTIHATAGTGSGTITVKATSACGSSTITSLSVKITTCVGIPENQAELEYQLFPNPNKGKFEVVLADETSMTITNLFGQVISVSAKIKGKTYFDLSEHAAGIYFILFEQTNLKRVVKIIKE